MLKAGDKAPSFDLPDQDSKIHNFSDWKGRWVFIFFYPKDNTPGCTFESCAIRDHIDDFKDKNIEVYGVSVDSVKSHKKFEKDHGLNYPLLSDEEKKVVELFGVWKEKSMFGKKYFGIERSSFLINPKGKIEKVYEKVNPLTHMGEVLKDIASVV